MEKEKISKATLVFLYAIVVLVIIVSLGTFAVSETNTYLITKLNHAFIGLLPQSYAPLKLGDEGLGVVGVTALKLSNVLLLPLVFGYLLSFLYIVLTFRERKLLTNAGGIVFVYVVFYALGLILSKLADITPNDVPKSFDTTTVIFILSFALFYFLKTYKAMHLLRPMASIALQFCGFYLVLELLGNQTGSGYSTIILLFLLGVLWVSHFVLYLAYLYKEKK